MKYLANGITVSRMVLSLALICFLRTPFLYIPVYILCGFSDIMDGFVARRLHTQSALGARLDSIADVLLFGVITLSMIILTANTLLYYLPYILTIVLIRIINVLIGLWKYRALVFLHTLGNKAAGLAVFLMPLFYLTFHSRYVILFVCMIAIASALEESLIHLTSRNYNLNRRSLFLK